MTVTTSKGDDTPSMIELHAPGGVVIHAPADGWEEGPGPDMQHCDNCGALEVLSKYEQTISDCISSTWWILEDEKTIANVLQDPRGRRRPVAMATSSSSSASACRR